MSGTAARRLLEAFGRTNENSPWAQTALARELAALSPRLGPSEAGALARQALEALGRTPPHETLRHLAVLAALDRPAAGAAALRAAEAMGRTTNGSAVRKLGATVAALAPCLGPREAGTAARRVLEAMGRTNQAWVLRELAETAAGLAPRLEPPEAGRLAGAAARRVRDVAPRTGDYIYLAGGVAALAPWLGPREAEDAARQVSVAMGRSWQPYHCLNLARALAALAPRLEPRKAARSAGEAARVALDAIVNVRTRDALPPGELTTMPDAVAALAPWLEPREAGALAHAALNALEGERNPDALRELARVVAILAPRLESGEAPHQAGATARATVRAMARTTGGTDLDELTRALAALASRLDSEDLLRRRGLLATAIGSGSTPAGLPAGLLALAEASRPLPGRFSEQQLVDLLKMPTCRQPARQAIVQRLGQQCGQPFANIWEFVAWAGQHRPDLDLTSPPIRPPQP